MCTYQFLGKYIIKADLRCLTGLHIGGTVEGFEIGGMDNPVIKDPITGYPYIPGSSLKGKKRSLMEWAKGKVRFGTDKRGNPTGSVCNCGSCDCDICIVFGCEAEHSTQPTRITIRDAFPTERTIQMWEENLGENIYTEVKTENVIDRLTSAANPRSMERVPANSVFEVEIIFDIYHPDDLEKMKIIFEAMNLLEDSSLGGSGSRGSGKVKFENFNITKRKVAFYTNCKGESHVALNGNDTPKDILCKFNDIFKKDIDEMKKVKEEIEKKKKSNNTKKECEEKKNENISNKTIT